VPLAADMSPPQRTTFTSTFGLVPAFTPSFRCLPKVKQLTCQLLNLNDVEDDIGRI
jgi:hypothetical protein